jgi:hypothetical protein
MIRVVDGIQFHGVVVAGKQDNGTGPAAAGGEHLGESPPPVFYRFWRVEDVPGPQHGVDGILLGHG